MRGLRCSLLLSALLAALALASACGRSEMDVPAAPGAGHTGGATSGFIGTGSSGGGIGGAGSGTALSSPQSGTGAARSIGEARMSVFVRDVVEAVQSCINATSDVCGNDRDRVLSH